MKREALTPRRVNYFNWIETCGCKHKINLIHECSEWRELIVCAAAGHCVQQFHYIHCFHFVDGAIHSFSINSLRALAALNWWKELIAGKRWLFHVTASSLITHQWIVSLFVADEVTFTITVIISFFLFHHSFHFIPERNEINDSMKKEMKWFLNWWIVSCSEWNGL